MRFNGKPTTDAGALAALVAADGTTGGFLKDSDLVPNGTWTPAITFATPGDLAVTYSQQAGRSMRIGRIVILEFRVATSAFTHTTASGAVSITGNTLTTDTDLPASYGKVLWQGVTKASYTDVVPFMNANATAILLAGSGSGQTISSITASDMPSGGTVVFAGFVIAEAA